VKRWKQPETSITFYHYSKPKWVLIAPFSLFTLGICMNVFNSSLLQIFKCAIHVILSYILVCLLWESMVCWGYSSPNTNQVYVGGILRPTPYSRVHFFITRGGWSSVGQCSMCQYFQCANVLVFNVQYSRFNIQYNLLDMLLDLSEVALFSYLYYYLSKLWVFTNFCWRIIFHTYFQGTPHD